MPIIDYKKLSEKSTESFYNRQDISEQNKEYIRKFLKSYNRSYARIDIFIRHTVYFLKYSKDIMNEMNNRDKINDIFNEIRKEHPKSYSTIVNVTNTFARWLNDGDKPIGFKDIKNISKGNQKRDLNPVDMLNWDDCNKLASSTNNIQFKAIIATQIDGGFRPSEFIDLNYGDMKVKKEFIIARVRDGKTGSRNVILWRAVPHLLRWMQNHPSKKENDPLWIKENNRGRKAEKYDYYAIQKRLKELGNGIGFRKPLDFYNLRHSACYLSKMDNVPEEIAAEKFGHSIQYYTATYARLSSDDVIERFSRHYDVSVERKDPEKNILCRKCDFVNMASSEFCEKCGSALSMKVALESDSGIKFKEELETMKSEFENYKKELTKFLFTNIKKQIDERIKVKIEA